MHFIPQEKCYVYFRYNDTDAVMVVLNNGNNTARLNTKRFSEILGKYLTGTDLVSGQKFSNLSTLTIDAKTSMIIELSK